MATSCFRRPRGSEPEEPEKLQEFNEFAELGVGGLTNEIEKIKSKVLNSRNIPDDLREIFGEIHVRGILLYGPPGTGKTLIARTIGKILKVKDKNIKDVKGPEILDKWIGSSEKNLRELFSHAEKEYKKKGSKSQLHIIIFDEIDAICKQRGSVADNTGVHDSIVTTLLVKLDSIKELNNILVIGLTNRKELIDEALLRPGRLEVHIPIVIPDEKGREEILNIHTRKMRVGKKLAENVNIKNLASMTIGFSGADIAGLVRDARSNALQPFFKEKRDLNKEKDLEALKKITITQEHFLQAIEEFREYSRKKNEISCLIVDGIIPWCEQIETNFDNLQHLIDLGKQDNSRLIKILITGAPYTGKTALSAQLAIDSNFQNVEICSPDDMVGFTEHNKCLQIKQIFINANKSTTSCVLIEDIELLLEYRKEGSHYSNSVLQTLLVLLRKKPPPGTKLFILCTSSMPVALEEMELRSLFRTEFDLPSLTEPKHIINVIEYLQSNDDGGKSIFDKDEITAIKFLISDKKFKIGIKTMMEYIDTARQMTTQRIVGFLSMICPEESQTFREKIKLDSRGLNENVLSYKIELIYDSINSVDQKKRFELKDTTILILASEFKDFEKQFKSCLPLASSLTSDKNFFKAKSVEDKKDYAIILFPYPQDIYKNIILNAIKLFSKLKSRLILQYKSSWNIEDDNCIVIQTELWSKTLTEFYDKIFFELQCENYLHDTMIGFYIMSELIEELFEGVNYMHQNDIIHRDLNPNKILLSDFSNGRTIKIADFSVTCISKQHSNVDNREMPFRDMRNTYCAPDVAISWTDPILYNEKVDIYSLGVISTDFFGFSHSGSYPKFVDNINKNNFKISIKAKIRCLLELVEKLTNPNPDKRPSSREVLNSRGKYFVNLVNWNDFIGYFRTQNVEINKTEDYCKFILSKFCYRIINDYQYLTIRYTSIENIHWLFSKILPDEIVKDEIVNSYNGFNFCILKSSKGKLYSFGENMFNQLGYETDNECNYLPKLINLVEGKVIEVSCGRNHVIVLSEINEGNKEVYSWGSNNSGEIGRSIDGIKSLPKIVDEQNLYIEKLQSISCGSEHSMALTESGHVFSWGNNIYGQLGLKNRINNWRPTPIDIGFVKISKISCGRIHSLLLSTDGDIYSFGANYNCQLGWKSTESNNKQTEPKRIELDPIIKFSDIRCHWRGDFSTALSTENEKTVCYIWGKCGSKVIEIPTLSRFNTCEQAVDELISEYYYYK